MSTCAHQLTFSFITKEDSCGHSFEFPLSIPSFCPGVTGNQKEVMSVFIQIKAKPSILHDNILQEIFSLGCSVNFRFDLQIVLSSWNLPYLPTLTENTFANMRIQNLKTYISCHFNLHKSSNTDII